MRRARTLFLTMTLATTAAGAAPAWSDTAIRLAPLTSTDRAPQATSVRNIYGSCASNEVVVLEVSSSDGGVFEVDGAGRPDVQVRRNGRTLLSLGARLSDLNTLACHVTPRGAFLVLGAQCSGSSCGDPDYTVVNMSTLAVVPAAGASCDAACVRHLTGATP